MSNVQKIGFLFGGNSAEREVSIVTMLQVKRIAEISAWAEPHYFFVESGDCRIFEIDAEDLCPDLFKSKAWQKKAKEVEFLHGGGVKKSGAILQKTMYKLDAVINCCHGGYGESGEFAGFFKVLKIPFSTHSHLALALSMHKHFFKSVMRSAGVLVPRSIFVTKSEFLAPDFETSLKKRLKKFPKNVVVKPNDSGSSLGISVATEFGEIMDALSVAFEFSNGCLIEERIENKIEFNCAVVGRNGDTVVSEVDQIESHEKLFSFEEKYIGGGSSVSAKNGARPAGKKCGMDFAKRCLPAPIDENLKVQIQTTAVKVFEVLGLSGVARVDFLYDEKTHKLFVGEVNAVPGSLALYFFKSSKYDVLWLIEFLVKNAIQESQSEKVIESAFVPKIF